MSSKETSRRSKSAGRQRSFRRSNRSSLSPHRLRDANDKESSKQSSRLPRSNRTSRPSSRDLMRQTGSSRRSASRQEESLSLSKRNMGNVSPGSYGITNAPVGTQPPLTLTELSPRSKSSRSTHSTDGGSRRRQSSKRRPEIVEEKTSVDENRATDSEEQQIAMDLFKSIESCSWKALYERMLKLKETPDTMLRVLSVEDTEDEHDPTILHLFVWKAPPALTKYIMDMIPSSHQELYLTTDADGNTPLHLCCANLPICHDGSIDTSVMKRLAKAAPKALHIANNYGDTPLHLLVSSPTCCTTDEEVAATAEEAIASLMDIDESICRLQDATGALPLHVAISCGANEVVLVKLFEASPTIANAKDECGMLPIHYVAAHGRTPLAFVDLLMEAYPDSIFEVTINGDTPLHILASNASVSMTDLSTQRMDIETERMIEFLMGSHRDDDSKATDEESVISFAGNRRSLLATNKEQVRLTTWKVLYPLLLVSYTIFR